MTKWYVNYPQYTAVAGVRAAFHQGRLTEYGFVGGGAGRARYVVYPYATSSTGGAIQLAGGADFNIKDSRFAWRIVDFSYSRFFVGPGLNSFSGSTGLVYHF
ncbi:MAG: hypothetical protein PW789_19960 [Edaphobacter sp.]|uniref:hypothetical protein n=1 Tax=Edaphobacter sp. TaxID=1934404 RepID=UPI00238BA7A3|nr:hypothetical protein [Edaphobacter sp.]MDE1178857.1 hypothetical protein [Edaphobacter sp.]